MKSPYASLEYAGDDFFVGVTPSGHAQVIDIRGERSAASGPTELLFLALGSCSGADVISVLQKKRQNVTGYRIEIRWERREEHPRSFRKMEVKHIIRGRGVSEEAVAKAVDLSTNKYCGVAATLRPTAEIVSSFEIIEEPEST
jgi:putative redox protein